MALGRAAAAVWLGLAVLSASWAAGCSREERFDGRPVSYWIAELRDGDPVRRARAADALGAFAPRSEQAVGALLSAFTNESNADVHAALATTLGTLGERARPAIPGLVRLLRDTHPEVRAQVATTLGGLGASTAAPDLVAALRDPDHDVRAAAAEALGRMGAVSSIPALVAAFGDRIGIVRLSALEALVRLRPPADVGVPVLRRALADRDEFVRRAACVALGRFGVGVARDVELVTELRERAAHDEWPEVRRAAESALEAIGAAAAPVRRVDPAPG